ncbi:LysM peptidoglycan-binding domain-containing protein [bacterium]|nr:LysM peptidoglycan-binding domain-containing protein [bacterium]
MNRRFFLTLRLRSVQAFGWVAAALAFFFGLTFSAQASPRPQLPQYATPTPGPDGRIIYIVQAGDNCISISTKTGVSIELLLGYNPMLDCDPVIEGQQLLLGYGGPAAYTPTPGPSPTPTIAPLTPTPFAGTTEVCILLYDDFNGNALREGTELGLAGGEVSVTDINGAYSKTESTISAIDPDTEESVRTCFADVPEGTFNISMAAPEGYNPTTDISYRLDVKAGDRAFVDFGAQSKSVQAVVPQEPDPSPNSPLMGILGAVLLLGGLGMGWYALRLRKPSSKFGGGKGMLRK